MTQPPAARLVLPCADLDAELAFFDRLGFAVEAIWPADAPRTAIVSGHGLRIELERSDALGTPVTLRLACPDRTAMAERLGGTELAAPSGARIVLVEAQPAMVLPPPAPSLAVADADAPWVLGRAGMAYRDLLPGRQGGRFVASQIRIRDAGPVPDYVHHHDIRLQLVYCRRGWVRVVYEDQGPPLVMQPGDCVLQPPHIRHRVLESSDGLEVIELACPAEHRTEADPAMPLPTDEQRPERAFGGQRFVHHRAAEARWLPWRHPGFLCRDTGIAAATDGLADVRVVRAAPGAGSPPPLRYRHDGELAFLFVSAGTLAVDGPDLITEIAADGAIALPADETFTLSASDEIELIEVRLPGD